MDANGPQARRMISFAPDEDQQLAASMLGAMARDVLRPAVRRSAKALPSDILDQLWQTGLVEAALATDPARPRSRTSSCISLEELGWGDAAMAIAIAGPLGFAQALADHGTSDQRGVAEAFAAHPTFTGAAVLVHESGFGFDPTRLSCRAARKGDIFTLNGLKGFVPLADRSSHFLVVARGDNGLDAFIVPTDSPGVRVAPAHGTLGLKSLALTDVHFDGVVVPAAMRLGGDNGCDVQAIIDSARVGTAAILTGVARAVLEHLAPYLKDRIAHGTALARKQSVAFRLADMAIDIPAMRWMCWQAACSMERGESATRAARLAQLHCAEQARWITDEGIQLMGGHGYMRENPVEGWYRDARMLASLEGVCGI